jgi:hypothetical protein
MYSGNYLLPAMNNLRDSVLMAVTKERVTIVLDKEVLEALDQKRNLSRSKYINDFLYLSLATDANYKINKWLEK